jgi:hypothetical protein
MLEDEIRRLGTELVLCNEPCAGILRNASAGILPRCLVIERSAKLGKGCFVAGINPGPSGSKERDIYRRAGGTYDSFLQEWNRRIHKVPYYKRLRHFINEIGLEGPILWSELAKCEKNKDSDGIPLQTLRFCSNKFLIRELAQVPPEWPLIGVGAEAYKALAYMQPNRTVLGIPHPTGSRGHFHRLFTGDHLRNDILIKALEVLDSSIAVTVLLRA